MRLIITGSLAYDTIMDFPGKFAERIMPDKIHVLSLSFLVDTLTNNIGGCATNLAYTLKLLGIDPLIMTAAGKDFGEMKEFFKKYGISTDAIKVFEDDYCSSYHVVTDCDDNQIGAFHIGASKYNKELSLFALKGRTLNSKARPYVTVRNKAVSHDNFVTIGPTDPIAMVKYVKECHTMHFPYLYDPAFQIANFTPEELKEGLAGSAITIGNDYEIALIEQKLGISHEELIVMVPVLITTLGPKGSIIETRTDAVHIKPAKVGNVIDPTGAGDAYRAGFLAGYLGTRPGLEAKGSGLNVPEGLTPETLGTRPGLERKISPDKLTICGQMGSIAAAYAVEKLGTVTHTFTKKEFIKRYQENYGTKLVL